jgi:hypothetical protein
VINTTLTVGALKTNARESKTKFYFKNLMEKDQTNSWRKVLEKLTVTEAVIKFLASDGKQNLCYSWGWSSGLYRR